MTRVLVLSDSEQLAAKIKSDLEQLDCLVWVRGCQDSAPDELARLAPEVLLFDLRLRSKERLAMCRRLSEDAGLQRLQPALILLLSEESLEHIDWRLAFDDFLLDPYPVPELALRLRRRLAGKKKKEAENGLQINELTIVPSRYEVRLGGIPLDLTYKEYELLYYLASHRGRAFTRDVLLNVVWGYDYYGGTRTVDVHIRRIRAKLGDEREEYIKTIRGVGYMFQD